MESGLYAGRNALTEKRQASKIMESTVKSLGPMAEEREDSKNPSANKYLGTESQVAARNLDFFGIQNVDKVITESDAVRAPLIAQMACEIWVSHVARIAMAELLDLL